MIYSQVIHNNQNGKLFANKDANFLDTISLGNCFKPI